MLKVLTLSVALAFCASAASAAPALDAHGKCRDGGKFVAASMCKKPAPSPVGLHPEPLPEAGSQGLDTSK
jgi:hypothetical protein